MSQRSSTMAHFSLTLYFGILREPRSERIKIYYYQKTKSKLYILVMVYQEPYTIMNYDQTCIQSKFCINTARHRTLPENGTWLTVNLSEVYTMPTQELINFVLGLNLGECDKIYLDT